jgi:hypothetical protein
VVSLSIIKEDGLPIDNHVSLRIDRATANLGSLGIQERFGRLTLSCQSSLEAYFQTRDLAITPNYVIKKFNERANGWLTHETFCDWIESNNNCDQHLRVSAPVNLKHRGEDFKFIRLGTDNVSVVYILPRYRGRHPGCGLGDISKILALVRKTNLFSPDFYSSAPRMKYLDDYCEFLKSKPCETLAKALLIDKYRKFLLENANPVLSNQVTHIDLHQHNLVFFSTGMAAIDIESFKLGNEKITKSVLSLRFLYKLASLRHPNFEHARELIMENLEDFRDSVIQDIGWRFAVVIQKMVNNKNDYLRCELFKHINYLKFLDIYR